MTWLLLLVSLTAAPGKRTVEPPATLPALESIEPKKKRVERWQVGAREGGEVEHAVPASAASVPARAALPSWLLLARFGGGLEVERPGAGVVGGGVEIAYRFRAADGLVGVGLALSASGAFSDIALADGSSAPSRAFRLRGTPLLSFQPRAGPGFFRFVIGPQLTGSWLGYASADGSRRGDWSSFSLGAFTAAGYAITFGNAALGVELFYAVAPYRSQLAATRLGHEMGGHFFFGWML